MIFYKTVSGGNDFLQIAKEHVPDKDALVRDICQRHTGAGADGVVFYDCIGKNGSPEHPIGFDIYNRDGSQAELSGNGMAGLAALMFYLDIPGPNATQVTLNTQIGQRTHKLLHRSDNRFRLNIEIGEPDFNDLRFFPFLEKGKESYVFQGLTFYPISVGNPHAVVVLSEPWEGDRLEQEAGKLAAADIFPLGVNVEIVNQQRSEFQVFFYERGVGPTHASSTGSAAVYAVLRHQGIIKDNLRLPGDIKISGKTGIFIENSAEIVYKGIYKKAYKTNRRLQPEQS